MYLAQCKICKEDNTYIGQTCQFLNERINNHRGCFVFDNDDKIQKSALSLHCKDKHENAFNLDHFKFMIYNKVNTRALDRRESTTISRLRTNVLGLNRMLVQKV